MNLSHRAEVNASVSAIPIMSTATPVVRLAGPVSTTDWRILVLRCFTRTWELPTGLPTAYVEQLATEGFLERLIDSGATKYRRA